MSPDNEREAAWAAAMRQWNTVVDDYEAAEAEHLRHARQVSTAAEQANLQARRPSRAALLSEVLMWAALAVSIGGGFALGLDPRACGIVLLVVMAGLYFWGRPR